MAEDIANVTISTTIKTALKVMITLVSTVGIIYFTAMQTFITHEEFDEHVAISAHIEMGSLAEAFDQRIEANHRVIGELQLVMTQHIEQNTIFVIQGQLQEAKDSLKVKQQRLREPGGDTRETREWINEYQGRAEEFSRQLDCLQTGGHHCLPSSG